MSRFQFTVGGKYSRSDIRGIVGLDPNAKGGIWDTGYVRHEDVYFILCNIGIPGRTGHDYTNYFDGNTLVWQGNTRSNRGQPTIQRMTSKEAEVHIFWRDDDHAPFTYAGLAQAISIADEVPVKVRWSFAHKKVIPGVDGVFPDEVDASPKRAYIEGATKAVLVNAYERNAAARNECVHHHGTVCRVCGFDFGKTYGEMGIGFIHIHHKLPIAEIGEAYTLNPINDLVPVCPNCHAMLHRSHPPMTVEQLILTLKKVGKT